MLQNTIPHFMKAAGYEGQYTNHFLRVSTATRLFSAGIDEQLIMSRTSHSSVSGVRIYKRKVEKLQEITSDPLNTGIYDDDKTAEQSLPCPKKMHCGSLPSVNVSGGSNNYSEQLVMLLLK